MPSQAITEGAVLLLLAACAGSPRPAPQGTASTRPASLGTVTGRYMMEGGASADSGPRPTPGTVRFTAAHHQQVTVPAGSSGTFSVRLPAGTYQVSGTSAHVLQVINGTSRPTPCSFPLTVTVTPRHATRITLTCAVP
jgi:hypothetical protein